MSEKTYTVDYTCGNCSRDFILCVEFGKQAPANAECTHCGCEAGKRKKPAIKVAPAERIVIHTTPGTPYPVYVPQPQPYLPYYTTPYWKQWEVWCGGGNFQGGTTGGWQGTNLLGYSQNTGGYSQ